MCWDATDRLWTYLPDEDQQYCRYWYTTDHGTGECRVGETGGWDGIPENFLARLPDKVKATYQGHFVDQLQRGLN